MNKFMDPYNNDLNPINKKVITNTIPENNTNEEPMVKSMIFSTLLSELFNRLHYFTTDKFTDDLAYKIATYIHTMEQDKD